MKRFVPLILILLCMLLVYITGLHTYLSLEKMREYHKEIKSFFLEYPYLTPILYMTIYTLSVVLSIPGAIFLTFFGGYLFDQPWSTCYVVFSATLGASIIFFAAKTALGVTLKEKAGPLFQKMQKGFQKNGTSYLLFLRLVPLFPFWLVNLAPAFLGVSFSLFFWTTFFGIMPGSLVFTLGGKGFARVLNSSAPFEIGMIFTSEVKIALSLLGILALLPVLLKNRVKS